MCQFNLLIIGNKSGDDNLKKTMINIGFGYRELENESLIKQIGDDKRIILTTKGHCDCGSIIGINHQSSLSKIDIEKGKKKLRKKKKKWSEAKIERYLADRLRKQSNKEERSDLDNKAEEKRWFDILKTTMKKEKEVGILYRQFRGQIENEEIEIEKINGVPIELLRKGGLKDLKENELNWIK